MSDCRLTTLLSFSHDMPLMRRQPGTELHELQPKLPLFDGETAQVMA